MKSAKVTFFLSVLLLLLLAEVSGPSSCFSRTLSEDEQLIRVGVSAFQDGAYDIAERQLSAFVKNFPGHPKVNDAIYLLARTQLLQGKLKEANGLFSRIIHESRSADSMDYVLFWAAQTEMRLGNQEAAR